ncbi:MAG: hypothetical protein ACHQ02_00920 [Candidatus Limnocylindrales bacterium]
MIAEAPFLFSIAALSASLAGLAGLVAALRRGTEMRGQDLYRLQQIVEFCFANILIALIVVPLAAYFGAIEPAVRIVAGLALVYDTLTIVLLRRRQRRVGLVRSRGWYVGATALNLLLIITAVTALLTGAVAPLEAMLIVLLARPMFAFVLVLQSFDRP